MADMTTKDSLDDLLARVAGTSSTDPDREDLAARIDATLAALPPDETSPNDRVLRARLEAYAMGLRGDTADGAS